MSLELGDFTDNICEKMTLRRNETAKMKIIQVRMMPSAIPENIALKKPCLAFDLNIRRYEELAIHLKTVFPLKTQVMQAAFCAS